MLVLWSFCFNKFSSSKEIIWFYRKKTCEIRQSSKMPKPRRKGMKLDQALKLYIALYCVCFLLTWLISVPMLIHVTPQAECLLFVTPYIQYGSPSGKSILVINHEIHPWSCLISACYMMGYMPIFVAVATLVLIVLHVIQLRSLKAFLRKPGPHSSSYHHRPTHIFWRMVSSKIMLPYQNF